MKQNRTEQPSSEEEQNQKGMKIKRLLPKKADYRMRAHINPLGSTPFPFPPHHTYVDWRAHYPAQYGLSKEDNLKVYCNTNEHPSFYEKPRDYEIGDKQVTVVDIGCGFGGLLFGLSTVLPHKLILGLEIRDKLVNFVGEKIRAYRTQQPGKFNNISVVHTNTMRHLGQYFPRASLQKIFICFPDPHFKVKNYRRRVINTGFLSQYAYFLKPNGRLYCITDVPQLHEWHMQHLRGHKMFEEIKDQEDPCLNVMVNKTEEGLKVERNKGEKYWGMFRRV